MTDEAWAEWEAVEMPQMAWRSELAQACDVAIQLRARLDAAIDELERARVRARVLLEDCNLACMCAEVIAKRPP